MSDAAWDKCFGSLKEDEIPSSPIKFDAARLKAEIKKYIRLDNKAISTAYLVSKFKRLPYLMECEQKHILKYVAHGSSRIAFAFSDGKALKIALNIPGVDQNITEAKNILETTKKYSCFPTIHDYDKQDGYFVLTDCCRRLRKSDLKNFFTIPSKEFYDILAFTVGTVIENWEDYDNDDMSLQTILTQSLKSIGEVTQQNIEDINNHIKVLYQSYDQKKDKLNTINRKAEQMYLMDQADQSKHRINVYKKKVVYAKTLFNILLDNQTAASNSIDDLLQYYIDNGTKKMLIDDLIEREDNWGIIRRVSHDAPVVIDAGFSSEVANRHYS